MKIRSIVSAVGCSLISACPLTSFAETANDLQEMVSKGSYNLNFRYRYEFVDQDGIDKEAHASTLKSRLTLSSAVYSGFSAVLEVDNVTVIGDEKYRTPENGKTEYPIVADPDGTDLNQLLLKYQGDGFTSTIGRQRINHGTQRFIGGVAWRQNEQTYDSVRFNEVMAGPVKIDYTYIWQVNRIFGPDNSPAQADNWDSDSHAITAEWKPAEEHLLRGFSYLLDFDQVRAASSQTYGVDYLYNKDALSFSASLATQSDYGDNPVGYDAMYYLLEGGYTIEKIKLSAGFEVLGSDDGNFAFSTPLATLHKFQGFSDKFLVTPSDGVEDIYVGVAGPLGPLKASITYHDLSSNEGSTDYGTEFDMVATWAYNEKFSVLLKYANYMADDYATDTEKFWLMMSYTF